MGLTAEPLVLPSYPNFTEEEMGLEEQSKLPIVYIASKQDKNSDPAQLIKS